MPVVAVFGNSPCLEYNATLGDVKARKSAENRKRQSDKWLSRKFL